jgi:hypothetical protein
MQAARGFYNITQVIKNALIADVNINTVSSGSISNLNLNKQDIFPLGHVLVNSVIDEENVLRFDLTIIACDIVTQSKDETLDNYVGNNNEQDILNTQLVVLNILVQRLRKGNLHQDKYQLENNPTLTPFFDRFENMLAGWQLDCQVLIHNDINICIDDV